MFATASGSRPFQDCGASPLFVAWRLYYSAFEVFMNLAAKFSLRMTVEVLRSQAGLVRKEVQLGDGLHYVYLEGGRGEPLVLLHGFDADKDLFTPIARFLTNRYRVIIPDHIGFGESAKPPDADYSPPAQAERLRAFAQTVGISNFHLGGSSMGGQIALTFAAFYPEKVKSLWLLDPAGLSNTPKSLCDELFETLGESPLLIRKEEDVLRVIHLVLAYPPPFVPRPILTTMAEPHAANYLLEKRISHEIARDLVDRRVKGLSTPSLIVWGSKDRLFRAESADTLNKLMPQSHVILMPHTGHLPMIERPLSAALDYLRFRTSLER